MIKKTKLIFLLFLVFNFFFIQISFIHSQNVGAEIDVSEVIGLKDIKIIGQGIEIQKLTKDEETPYSSIFYKITFVENNSFLKIKESFVETKEDIFTNIIPQEIAKHPTYIDLDKKGQITNADFTVNENGGNYIFGDKTIEAPPGSRIFYNNLKGIEIKLPDELDLTNFPNFIEAFSKGYLTKIKGKNIELPNGIKLIDGELEIKDNGFLLNEGVVEYKQMKMDSIFGEILIANSDADLSNYEGNWIKQTSNLLEMQSGEKGGMQVEFLENHEILNTDLKDDLIIIIDEGDGLKIENRKKEELIPKIIHKNSEKGTTEIYNDGLTFLLDKEDINLIPQTGLKNEDFSKKYQSVALEIESDSEKINEKIRVNSYRQFTILDKNDNELVSYNKYDLPVSAKIKDNELQTLEQLRKKYFQIDFEIIEDPEISSKFPKDMNESDFPPYLIYYTDIFLEAHPDAKKNLGEITYGNYFRAFSRSDEINIGRLIVDPSETEYHKRNVREITNPIYIFQHEYEHRLDHIIKNKEFDYIKRINNPEIESFFINEWYNNINVLNNISKKYYEQYPESMLQQCYNKIAINAIKELDKDEYIKELKSKGYFNEDEYISLLTGIPYEYSLKNSNKFSDDISLASYSELSSTYREQPIEIRKMNVQSANPTISNMYKKLTQLDFDSGKMDLEEYKEIMGKEFCKTNDCLDKICIEYKLLCCKEHPNSPNC